MSEVSQQKNHDGVDLDRVSDRLKQVCNVSQDKDLAKLLGISQTDFANRKKRGSLFPLLINHAINANMNLNWLIWGRGPSYITTDYENLLDEAEIQKKCLDAEEYLLLPLLQSWVKGGPEGRLIYEGIADHYPFKRHFIEKLVGARPERQKELYLARVKGDSMAPTINDNEIILFDTNEVERIKIRTGQIYVVQLPEGSVTVKRLSLSIAPQEARLICHSDNVGVYKMFDFTLDPGRPIHSYVLGRVRWAGKEFD
ncbi:MAG: S24 family peptidase [Syntrophobacteraceae bacterium]